MGNGALDAARIRAGLTVQAQQALAGIQVFPQLDSTNRWALQQAQCGELCLAEQQTAGRGRRGREWQSPSGVNIYFSLRWCFGRVPEHLPMLGLVVGLAVAEALGDAGLQGHGLKWPNDLYHQGRKLGGILLEAVGSLGQVVVGIGLNVNMLPDAGGMIDQPWTSVQALAGIPCDRNLMISRLLNRLLLRLQAFLQLDMVQFQRDWGRWDVLAQQAVRVLAGGQVWEGVASGVDTQGQLQLLRPDGTRLAFSSADVSVRM
jgi:BirA family biotin operon repressor/biotin-[acetyl-CoA-carboxylase] ligase